MFERCFHDHVSSISLPPPDPHVPELITLLGEDAHDLIGAIVAAGGRTLRKLQTTQVRYVPGTSVTVQYRAEVEVGGGRRAVDTYVAAAGISVPEQVPVLESDGMRIAVWRFPDDPFLPGLAVATDAERVAALLQQLGARTGVPRLRTRAYRPGRRAVVEATTGAERIFIKVLRPDKVPALQDKHVALAGTVPVPHSHGWSAEYGLVALQAMPGKTLRKVIEGGTRRIPGATALVGLLDRFPRPDDATSPVSGPLQRVEHHAATLAAVLPEARSRLEALVAGLETGGTGTTDAVHGDFHASQVLVRGDSIVGLVDVDTAGTGERIDDLANFTGHLATLALVAPAKGRIGSYRDEVLGGFDAVADPNELRRRVAAVIVGLATGPFRVQEDAWPQKTMARIELAERWLATTPG